MTIQNVSEFAATAPEQIEHFAKLLTSSAPRRKVFWEVYRGQSQRGKTAEEISKRIPSLSPKRVLEIATPLANSHLFEKIRRDGLIAYRKYPNINTVKQKIMRLAKSKEKLKAHVTVRNSQASARTIIINVPRQAGDVYANVRLTTVDDIENFSKVRYLQSNELPAKLAPARLSEKIFKYGVANILGNRGTFKDWGGEKNDLYSSHLKIKGRRYAAAIGLKGPATTGTLTPGKMGKNGDQIQRLFDSDAQVFVVQYEGQIAQSVSEQMKAQAVNKSVQDRRTVFYSVIALEDSYRLRVKYAKQFEKAKAAKQSVLR
ncbi:MAG: hypothetical protein ACRD4S_15465 [Candidatus Acidiferrales bacterium]